MKSIFRAWALWLVRKLTPPDIEPSPPSRFIEAVVYGQQIKATAHGVTGLHLVCDIMNGSNTRVYLLDASQACDQSHFWRLWRHLGGQDVRWDDGTPFQPDIDAIS